jgi:tetratricopeptide (TPR) repeat protein
VRAGLLALVLAAGAGAQAPVPSEETLLRAEVQKLENAYKRPGADRGRILKRLAEALRSSQDPQLVARGLRIALDLDPEDHQARTELAEQAQVLGRKQVALRLFERVIQAQPGNAQARMGLGYVYEGLGRNAEALAQFEEIVRRDPKNVQALVASAQAYMTLDRPEKALKRARGALAVDSSLAEARKVAREAAAEIAAGAVDGDGDQEPTPAQRVALLRGKLVDNPGDPTLRKTLAFALLDAAWAGEARLEFLALLGEVKDDPDLLVGLARAHREEGDISGAKLYAERALMARPRHQETITEVARIWEAGGNVGLARKTFGRLLELFSAEPVPYLEAGLFEFSQKKLDVADAYLEKGMALAPTDPTMLAARARVKLAQGRRAEALALVEKSRKLDGRDGTGWRALAEVRQALAQWRPAIQAWQEVLFLSPFDPGAWVQMARCLAEADEHAESTKALDVALALDDEDAAILDAAEAALARLAYRPDTEEMRVLLMEKRGHLLRRDGDFDGAVRLLEHAAEERSRQIRVVQEALGSDPPPSVGKKRAQLRRMLQLTKAKVRVHEGLAELYLDLERDDDVERQYHELHALDPGSAETIRKLASFYYDAEDYKRTIAWIKRLPDQTRLTQQEGLDYATALDATGREQQAERVYKQLAKTTAPTDEVEQALADHASRKGNNYAAYRHWRRSLSLFSGNQPSLESVRSIHKAETPDYWVEHFKFNDSDGIKVSQNLVGARTRLNDRMDFAATISRFKAEDRITPEIEDTGFQALLGYEISERFRLSTIVGLVRFSPDAGVALDARLDWNPDDRYHLWLRFFQDSVNETPAAAVRGFEQTGFELDGTWFATHRFRLNLHMEETNITGDNHRSIRHLDLGMRPFGPAFPGWLHLARGNLAYDRRVAPILYFAPADLDRVDLYYEVSTELGEDLFLNALVGLLDDVGFGKTKRAVISAQLDRGPAGSILAEYKHIERDRSYHDFTTDFRADELFLQYRGEF